MDKTLYCRDCGGQFVFTAGEQEFFAARGFANPPSRCPNCRAANKARRNGLDPAAAPPPRPPRQTFAATCARCGKQTEVPFEPRLGRPVYCRDCFVPRERTSPAPAYASVAPSRGEASFAPREGDRPRRRNYESRDAERYERSYEKSFDYERSYDGSGDEDEDSEYGGGRGRRSRRR